MSACPRTIDITKIIIAARTKLPPEADRHYLSKLSFTTVLATPSLLNAVGSIGKFTSVILGRLPKTSGLKDKLSLLDSQRIKQSRNNNKIFLSRLSSGSKNKKLSQISYFSGCLASHLYPDIASATACLNSTLLNYGSTQSPTEQTCCGLAAKARGDLDEARKLAKKNILSFSNHDLPVLTSCASCFSQLKSYPDLFQDDNKWLARAREFAARVQEFSTFFNKSLKVDSNCLVPIKQQQKIFYHDPCHLRFSPNKIIQPPRQLLKKITGKKPIELTNGPCCCGHGGLFSLANPDLSDKIFQKLLDLLGQTTADTVLTTCSGCLLQWQGKTNGSKKSYRVEHLAVFLIKQLLPKHDWKV